ncbi:JAB domain-containing protein [Alkalimarinus alittae]|uniref:DNA repair protein RadC n=1 Tax=Alkalimarinus alittae TaxID=2961619 RepID=A0ABY6N5I6_9ALTE|nr:DNA repair protein RadC [Alkalimarinus alittae]UZE97269.1 DNA repair protein RadC [Alkalimarinus alittae]
MKYHKFKAGEEAGTYIVDSSVTADDILKMARQLARNKLSKGSKIQSPKDTFEYLEALYRNHEHEVFGIIYLNNQNRVIASEELFRGTIDGASVYPREVVKQSLTHNAAALIIYHNHPSGEPEPSECDKKITLRLQKALLLVDIKVLDHIVVATNGCVSLAQRGVL